MESVLNQQAVASGRVRLDYIICDGQSTDRTLEVVKGLERTGVRVRSEKDNGLYDALAKGLRTAEGEVVAYLNAGDLYAPKAFDVVLDIFEQKDVRWLTGLNVLLSEQGEKLRSYLPYRYRQRLIDCGLYGKVLAHIQQESTFWSRELHDQIDFDRLKQFKLAGDFYLWSQFSRAAQLHIVAAHLGGFRLHRGQQSEDRAAYQREMRTLTRTIGPMDWCLGLHDGLLYYLHWTRLKKRWNPDGLFVRDEKSNHWR